MSDQSTITKPTSENVQAQTPVRVFSMPERYRHGAMANVVEPQKPSVPIATAPIAPAVPVRVPVSAVSPIGMKNSSQTTKYLLIAGGVVLVALAIGGFILVQSSQKTGNVPVAVVPATPPTPTPAPPAPTVPTPTPVVPVVQPPVTSPFVTSITPGVDTDSDGLSDVEETIVYGTDPHLPDTDGDGFLDGNEVFHGYNPNGTAPATLLGAKLVQPFAIDGYQMFYPTKWTEMPSNTNGYVISTTTGEKFMVNLSTKAASMSLPDWYAAQIPQGEPLTLSKTIKSFPFMMTKNQLTAYVDLGTEVLTIVYDTGSKSTVDYVQTFQMMINSVIKK